MFIKAGLAGALLDDIVNLLFVLKSKTIPLLFFFPQFPFLKPFSIQLSGLIIVADI